MRGVFVFRFTVRAAQDNPAGSLVGGAFATCCVLEQDSKTALNWALFNIARDGWEVIELVDEFRTDEAALRESPEGRQRADALREYPISTDYVAWPKDAQSQTRELIQPRQPASAELNKFVTAQKRLRNIGRCLHFDAGAECHRFAAAHSIQQGGILREISENGHVYAPSVDVGTLRRNSGWVVLERRGISTVSRFRDSAHGMIRISSRPSTGAC